MIEQYDEDYYLHGKQTGKSLYEDYRWMPDLTIPMVERMIAHLGIKKGDTVLDFGCARGYTVRAFRELGYQAFGTDVSEWAIANADESVKPYVWSRNSSTLSERRYDWIIAKDVLEHIEFVVCVVKELMGAAVGGIFAVVPLALFNNTPYVITDYEKDITHVQRHDLLTWVGYFLQPGWRVEASYQVPGVKDNYKQCKMGNGFITARRLA